MLTCPLLLHEVAPKVLLGRKRVVRPTAVDAGCRSTLSGRSWHGRRAASGHLSPISEEDVSLKGVVGPASKFDVVDRCRTALAKWDDMVKFQAARFSATTG